MDSRLDQYELTGKGADLEERSGKAVVTRVGIGSGASHAGLSANDEILAIDAVRGDVARIRELLSGRRPGEVVKLLVSRHDTVRELAVTLGPRTGAELSPPASPGPTPLQSAIYESWMTGRQASEARPPRTSPYLRAP